VTRAEYEGLVLQIEARWPGKGWPDATAVVGYADLGGYTQGEVSAAIRAFAVDGNAFPPTSGQLLGMLLGAQDRHDEAWGLVRRAIARYGYPQGSEAVAWLEEQDPQAAETVRNLGWLQICHSEKEDVIRAQFREAYKAAANRAQRNAGLAAGQRTDDVIRAAAEGSRLSAPAVPKLPDVGTSQETGDDRDDD